jgi:hypothetical protein
MNTIVRLFAALTARWSNSVSRRKSVWIFIRGEMAWVLGLAFMACVQATAVSADAILAGAPPSVSPGPSPVAPPHAGFKLPDLAGLQLERTFVCVGPACLRSGVGLGVGVGCGVGAGMGFGYPVTEKGSSFDSVGRSPLGQMLAQLPGGYTAIEAVRKVLAQFPNSRIGAGCGVGLGYGAGLGLMWGSGPSAGGAKQEAADHGQNTDELVTRLGALESRVASLEGQIGIAEKLVNIQDSLARIEARR